MDVYGKCFVYLAAAILLGRTAVNTGSFILFGSGTMESGLSLKQVGEWLLFLSPVLYTAGNQLETELEQGAVLMIRYRKRQSWWLHLVLINLRDLIIYLGIVSVLIISQYAERFPLHYYLAGYLLLATNMIFLVCVIYLLRSCGTATTTAILSVLLIVGLGLYFLSGCSAWKFCFFGFWGMFQYSSLCAANGFWTEGVLIMQASGIGICVMLLRKNVVWERLS